MSGGSDFTFACQVMRDDPDRQSIAVADGTMQPDPHTLTGEPRLKWFFIPRSLIRACEPPLDALPASGPRMVTLTIPEWKAVQEGLT